MKVNSGNEIWKDVPGYEGLYQVSNTGRVKALSVLKYWGKTLQKRKEIIFKPTIRKWGYAEVVLSGKTRLNQGVHRLVALAFIPNPDNKPQVNHKDGNKLNNSVSNLEWATRQEQMDHAISLGLVNSVGESNPNSKLTPAQVLEIRALKGIKSAQKLAAAYSVGLSAIQKIHYRQTWANL